MEHDVAKVILIVDDDPGMRNLLRNIFEPEGFSILEARSSAEAYNAIAGQNISLVMLDLVLGSEDGLVVGREIRKLKDVPIVMVTAKGDDVDRIVGLELGADDYIVKPFNVREVLARVRAVLRRTVRQDAAPIAKPGSVYLFAGFEFNVVARVLKRIDPIDSASESPTLTSAEFDLMEVFLEHPNHVLSRAALISNLGGDHADVTDRSIDTMIARLRKKIETDPAKPEIIKTSRGVGYVFAATVVKR